MAGRSLLCAVAALCLAGCDVLEPRGGFDAAIYSETDGPVTRAERAAEVERSPSPARVTAAEIEACHAAHQRVLAENPPPPPDQIALCTGADDCVAHLALGPPLGLEPEPPRAPRHNLHLEVELDEALLPWMRGGAPGATLTVRDAASGATVLEQPIDASVPLVTDLLLDSERSWEIAVGFDGVACHGGVGGVARLAGDLVVDRDTTRRLSLGPDDAARLTGELRVADGVPERDWLARSVWAVRMRRVDGVSDRGAPREVFVGSAGAFELDVFPGVYDVYVERIDEIEGERLECRDRSQFEQASLGQWRVAEGVEVADGGHLDLELRPIAVDVEFVPDAHLPPSWSNRVDLTFDPAPRSDGARRHLEQLDADRAHRVWLWPGTYEVDWTLSGIETRVWARDLEVELTTSRRLDLGLGAHRLTLETNLDDPARPGWLREMTVAVRVGGREEETAPGAPIYLPTGTYGLDLRWEFGGLYHGRAFDVVEGLVVDDDRVVVLDDLPMDARVRLEWVAPEPEPIEGEDVEPLDADDEDDEDEPFSQEPPESDAAVLLVDPVAATTHLLSVDNRQWRDATLATAHVFAGVYDVMSTDGGQRRWPLASCLAIDGGEPRLVPWRARTRPVVLDIVGLDARKPLELEFRLVDSVAVPGHRWSTPRTLRLASFVEPPTLHLVPGTWEIGGFQDWGGGELEPVVLEVR